MATLENFAIGDAKLYIENENSFSEWLQDIKSHIESLRNIHQQEEILQSYGQCIALNKALQNLNFYLQQKERIENFKKNIQDGINKEEADCLEGALNFKLSNLEH